MTPRVRSLLWFVVLVGVAWGLRAPFLQRELWNLDEGSTFTMAEQVRHGAVLYRDAADNRGPLVPYLKAAVFAVAGDWNIRAQHVAMAVAWGVVAWLLRDIARRLGDPRAGAATAVAFTFVCLLLPGILDSLAIHTEAYVVLFSTLGFWFVTLGLARPGACRGIAVGFAFAAGSLCKQPGALDFGVALLLVLTAAWHNRAERRLWRMLVAASSAFVFSWALVCAYFWFHGAWSDFVYYAWTFNARLYVPEVPLLQRLAQVRLIPDLAWHWVPVAIPLAAAGIVIAARDGWRAARTHATASALLPAITLGWLASGFATTVLSGRDFPHYAIQAAPALSLAAGLALARLAAWAGNTPRRRWRPVAGYGALAMVAGAGVWSTAVFLRRVNPQDGDPRLREIIQQFAGPNERILVWGYYPEAYAIARRLPATRFIYTNYLTGMIPWTNLAPDRDTRYAIVPGAWEAFWRDYRAHPPAVIVDANMRGYVKYPLLGQPGLREEVIDHFAEVRPDDTRPLGARVLCRLDDATTQPFDAAANVPRDPSLQLDADRDLRAPDVVVLTLSAPRDATEILIRVGGRPYRRLRWPGGGPVSARLDLRLRDLAATSPAVDMLVRHRSGAVSASSPLDVAACLVLDLHADEPAPVLTHGWRRYPAKTGAPDGRWTSESIDGHPGWRSRGSFTLTFERPPPAQTLRFRWKTSTEHLATTPGPRGLFTPVGGETRSLPTRIVDISPGMQEVTIELPQADPGDVTVASDAGGWLGEIAAQALGPELAFGDLRLAPAMAIQNDQERLAPAAGEDAWEVQAFGRLLYPRRPGMQAVTFEFAPAAAAARVILEANFLPAEGPMARLFARGLEPASQPSDRGWQRATVMLPAKGRGDIEFRVVPNGGPNPANRLRIRAIRAQGIGPDLILGADRVLVPSEATGPSGDPLRTQTADGWLAHAPSRVVYSCPADVHAVSFGFGLPDQAWTDEHGNHRSDGIGVVVEFIEGDGEARQLWSRELDAFARPADRGPQHARITLPGTAGRLVIRVTPGPRNDPSFDWAYLTAVTGEVAPGAPSPQR